MKLEECRLMDETFSHIDEDGVERHWNISALARDGGAGKVEAKARYVKLEEHWVEHVRHNHGIEPEHLKTIDVTDLAPLVIAELEDGKHVVIDGNHRLIAAWDAGVRRMPALIIMPADWQPYLIEGVPSLTSLEGELLAMLAKAYHDRSREKGGVA